MVPLRSTAIALVAATLLAGLPASGGATTIGSLRFVGVTTIANDQQFDGTLVGGLSGLDTTRRPCRPTRSRSAGDTPQPPHPRRRDAAPGRIGPKRRRSPPELKLGAGADATDERDGPHVVRANGAFLGLDEAANLWPGNDEVARHGLICSSCVALS